MSDLAIVPLITRGWPFCPLWYHTFGLPSHFHLTYLIRWIIAAAIRNLASRFAACRADDYTIKQRRTACDECQHREEARCGICKCPIDAKTALARSFCPDTPRRWEAVATVGCRLLTALEQRGILFDGPVPQWVARFTKRKPWGGESPGCQACNDADKRNQA